MAVKNELPQRFLTIFNRLVATNQSPKLLLALSGGVDSVVLYELLKENNISFEVAHCNFQLRGTASDEDLKWVADLCKKDKIRCHLNVFDTKAYAQNHKISIEMAARELRYKWFRNLMETYQIDFLLVAHHANDNLETAILNLTKGSGISGLKGMSEDRDSILRPLLSFDKEEIVSYANAQKLTWREDVTNSDSEFQRNLLRNKVIPLLQEINPNASQTYVSSAWRVGLWHLVLIEKLEELNKDFYRDQQWEIPHNYMKDGLGKAVLMEFLNSKGFDIRLIKDFFSKENYGQGTKYGSPKFELIVERNYFLLREKVDFEPVDLLVNNNQSYVLEDLSQIELQSFKYEPNFEDQNTAFFEEEKLVFPLKIRTWKIGDKMKPFGMRGSKMISDLIIDYKVPNHEKSKVKVLLSGEEIIWCIGLRTSEKFRIKDTKKGLIRIIYTK